MERRQEDRLLWDSFKHHSRTFSFATRLLPANTRLPVAVVYYYCRMVDNVADELVLTAGPEAARQELDLIEAQLNQTFEGSPPSSLPWPRLGQLNDQFGLDDRPFRELLDGARWDLDRRPIRSLSDLKAYSNLVAGSVGAMVLPFLADQSEARSELETAARSLGNAMQMTNICRDVGEDLRTLDRIYLPADLMELHGVTAETLAAGKPTPGYRALLEDVMTSAEELYDAALPGVDQLPGSARKGVQAALRIYRQILNEVRSNEYDNLSKRAYVTLRKKCLQLVTDGYDREKKSLIGDA